jgi:hypothetical protein
MAPIMKTLQVKLKVFIEVCFDCFPKLGLVVLEADHEIATAIDDVTRDLFLATHGIDRDQRVLELDLLQ